MINIFGVPVDWMNVEHFLSKLQGFFQDDRLNLAALITQQRLLKIARDEEWRIRYRCMDLNLVSEKELFDELGADALEVVEELQSNVFFDRIFWQIVKHELRVFILGDNHEKTSLFLSYLSENYTNMKLTGSLSLDEGISADGILNRINVAAPDLILGGLDGDAADLFVLENQTKIYGRLWLSLGEIHSLQKAAGFKSGFLDEKKLKFQLRQALSDEHWA